MRHYYVRLIGGLGNQLFQYATARALAIANDVEVRLNVTAYENSKFRRYELHNYPIKATLASTEEIAAITNPRASAAPERLAASGGTPMNTAQYGEPHFHFDSNLAAQKPPVLLCGYWQSERYFKDIADRLRIELTPIQPLEPENASIAEDIASHTAVSVHVRRGDYITNPNANAFHGVCPLDYYQAAVRYIADRVPNTRFYVFSDDPQWTAKNLKTGRPTTYVAANPPDRGFRDMQLMSRCRHHIIANSSFSWWGAWLNPSPDKIIVAPAQWFAVNNMDTSDLIPEDWVRL